MCQKLSEENKADYKILFYIGNLYKGGAQRVLINLANYFRHEGYEIVLATAQKEQTEYVYDEGIKRIISDLTPEEKGNSRIGNFCHRIRKLRRLWKAEKPDIIISFMGKSNLFALLSSLGLKIPVLVSVRSDPNREYTGKVIRILSKTLFAAAAGVVLQTEEAVNYFPWYIRKKAVIMPNSIDRRYIQERCMKENRKNEIVTAGTIDENKNQEMLIRAFADIEKDFPKMKLIIYGDGCLREKLCEQVKTLGLEQKVSLPGRENEIYHKIHDSRIFVLTSRAEGMPNALLEAMAMGLAVVSTDCPCGGPRTLIQDGKNGFLIPVGDEAALSAALRRILTNRELEEQIGTEAYKWSEKAAPDKVNRMWQEYIESKMKKKC